MTSYKHYDLEYCLTINVQAAKRRFVFFLTLISTMCLIIFLGGEEPGYGHEVAALYTTVGIIGGVLLLFDKINHIRAVGFILCSSIFAHALAEGVEVLYDVHSEPLGVWLTTLVWFAFGYSFAVNWSVMIEPYFEGYRQLVIEEKTLRSSLRPEKNPICIECINSHKRSAHRVRGNH